METPRTVLVSGATGLVGRRLVPRLLRSGAVVRILTRDLRSAGRTFEPRVLLIHWDGRNAPVEAVGGADAVVHLSGEPVFSGRLTASRKARIRESRVASTHSLARAIGALDPPERPQTFLCASAVGYYGDRGDEILDEEAPAGDGFLAEVCRAWEAAAAAVERHGSRRVSLRIGIVLAREGGALPLMARPFRLGLGGRLGSGQQWFPWIHVDDLVELVVHALGDRELRGAVNGVAPKPVRNVELTRLLAEQLGRPAVLPVPGLAIRAALGELATELLGSRRVVPRRAEAAGFAFQHEELPSALQAELASRA